MPTPVFWERSENSTSRTLEEDIYTPTEPHITCGKAARCQTLRLQDDKLKQKIDHET